MNRLRYTATPTGSLALTCALGERAPRRARPWPCSAHVPAITGHAKKKPPTDPQRCPSQRPRPPRRPHWRSPCRCTPCAACRRHSAYPPTYPHLARFPAPSHPLLTTPQPRRRPTAPIPPDGAARARPAPAPPDDAQPHRAASPHALPRDTRRSIHSDRPCPPSSPPLPPQPRAPLVGSRDSRCTPTPL